jgi:hypothetical protein
MGADPYWYIVPYEQDINAALQRLRQREFRAGRYNPVMPFIEFPIGPGSPAPGAGHDTIEAAFEEADADGTRSILDLDRVSPTPNDGEDAPFQTVFPLADETLEELFGTREPTREMVLESDDLWERLDRGWGVYVVLFSGEKPTEIYFAGYSFD